MIWKSLVDRFKRTVSQPDRMLLIELAAGAFLLAWAVHWAVE
jgi:hypothetical protein